MEFLKPEWRDRVSSTNTVLLSRLASGERLTSGYVLAAKEQTAGRGRYDRRWASRPGRDLTFSFLLLTDAGFPKLSSLTMAVALGVADAIQDHGVATQVKWPNDLLASGCKICGILAERNDCDPAPGEAVVVGVGVNVNMEGHEAAAIDRPATSVLIESGRSNPVESVLQGVLDRLPHWVDRWEEGGFPALHDEWFSRHCAVGERVTVGAGDGVCEGLLAGFGESGQLLLRNEQGEVREVWAGDVGLL